MNKKFLVISDIFLLSHLSCYLPRLAGLLGINPLSLFHFAPSCRTSTLFGCKRTNSVHSLGQNHSFNPTKNSTRGSFVGWPTLVIHGLFSCFNYISFNNNPCLSIDIWNVEKYDLIVVSVNKSPSVQLKASVIVLF